MKKLLIVVDMQNDFIDGGLGTAQAQAVVERVVKKINEYKRNGEYILYTMDTHEDNYMDTQEGRFLPVEHCIYPSTGWNMNDQVREAIAGALEKQDMHGLKAEYKKPAFGSWDLAEDLKNCQEEIESVELAGVCTGICVLSNAVLIKAALPELPVKVDASCCACVTPESHETALKAMELLQIEVTNRASGI